jgi:hypothetical protein
MPGIKGTMHEFGQGTLKSSSGQKVTNPKQAVAIGLSEERAAGNKKVGPPPERETKSEDRAEKKQGITEASEKRSGAEPINRRTHLGSKVITSFKG